MHNHIISNKPGKGPTWELYRLNSQNIDIVIPTGIDPSDFNVAAYRNGIILAATMQPICTVDGQKINAAFSLEKLRQLPDTFDLAILRGDKHLAICPVRLSTTPGINNCHAGTIHIGGDNYVSIQLSANGSDGLSAYQLAVENGFVGSVEEWLSTLHGKDGLDGEITQERLISILQELGVDLSYGVEWDKTAASSACTRIGNMKLHASLPIQSQMRGCLLRDDGRVNYYLDAEDWSKKADGTPSDLTGSHGQVMVEIPEHYRTLETVGDMQRILLSQYPLQGFSKVEKFYYAAYNASLNRTTLTTASVQNTTAEYRGGDNTAAWDGTYRSLLGKPAGNISRANWTSFTTKRGENWRLLGYSDVCTIRYMFYVEYADRNSQLPVNNTLTIEGFRQGGLGLGCTDLTGMVAYNNNNAVLSNGITNALGNNSGEIQYIMPTQYGTKTTQGNRYRGIENIFGHLSEVVEGLVRVQRNNATDGLYYTDDPEKYTTNEADFVAHWSKLTPPYIAQDFYSQAEFKGSMLIPAVLGGSSNTFYTDSFGFYNYPATPVSFPTACGNEVNGQNAGIGMLSFSLNNIATALISSRITYHPPQ